MSNFLIYFYAELFARISLTIWFLIISLICFYYYKTGKNDILKKLLLITSFIFIILFPWGDVLFEYCFNLNISLLSFHHFAQISTPLCFSIANIFEPFHFNKNRSILSRGIEAFLLLIAGTFSFKYYFLTYLLWFMFLIYAFQAFYFQTKTRDLN